ncbi:hypothetical protein BD309DRAFT_965938 [Dichomitus squalens]|uniref:Uncharacterized protein n=1 Tax=Dichomitus squalens TaxID=114155 RepID=A0A4Q9NKG8_9APHY|nr:hypothetical protein BD309DRAFT_965938 [Dichomitus squalens]TBU55711.1 hypothetical protein BD310DRAFT_933119 [Dichomitus squalens]
MKSTFPTYSSNRRANINIRVTWAGRPTHLFMGPDTCHFTLSPILAPLSPAHRSSRVSPATARPNSSGPDSGGS